MPSLDPLTHIVIGRAVVAAAQHRRSRAIGAAAVLGALSPDIDTALAFRGWDRYIRAHQFGTHSLAGAVVMALVTAVVVDRSRKAFPPALATRATADPPKPSAKARALTRPRFAALFAAAAAGAMSHIALDLMSGARIALGWPLLESRVSLPLVAMADPWFVAICLVWILLLWPARVRLLRASRVVVAAATVFLCLKAALLTIAVSRSGITPQGPSAYEARWGSLTHWFLFERSREAVRTSSIASAGGPAVVLMSHPLRADTPLVRASRSLDDVQNFLAVHEFAFAEERRESDGTVSVMWSDLRYCSPSACGVWVGGTFDANRRPITQEVRVGTLVQRRPPATQN